MSTIEYTNGGGSHDSVAALADGALRRPLNRAAVEHAARELLEALGADLASEGLRGTPRRMADAFGELLTTEPFDLTTFSNDEGYDELVVVRDIPFQSLCMHHVLPFHGVAHVGYLPGERILGCQSSCEL